MKLENTFSIPVPVDEAWRVLLDVERIAPCVPGATLTSSEGDTHHGKVKVKLGPIGLTYNGTVEFVSQDEAAKVAVLVASGRESRGNGTAKAQVTCRLVANGDSTDVLVETELDITGKPAQFGRGALAEVSGALMGQFAANLADELTNGTAAPEPPSAAPRTGPADTPADTAATTADTAGEPTAASAVREPAAPADRTRTTPRPAAEPFDLLDAAGGGALKRYAPIAAGAAALLLLAVALRRRGPAAPQIVYAACCPCNHTAAGTVVHPH